MTETLIVTGPLTVERTLQAGTKIVAASDVPSEGPWDAMLSLSVYPIADPSARIGGVGVEVGTATKVEGAHVIAVTPANLSGKMPFTGTLKIG